LAERADTLVVSNHRDEQIWFCLDIVETPVSLEFPTQEVWVDTQWPGCMTVRDKWEEVLPEGVLGLELELTGVKKAEIKLKCREIGKYGHIDHLRQTDRLPPCAWRRYEAAV